MRHDRKWRVNHSPAFSVIDPNTDDGRWTLVLGAPDIRLRGYVCEYQGYTEQTAHVIVRREIPSGEIPFIINFGPQFRLLDRDDPDRGEEYGSFAAGLHDTYALVESTGKADCLQVNLTAIGAQRLLGLPLRHLVNRAAALEDLLGSAARPLIDRLYETPDWQHRFAILDAFFAQRLVASREAPPTVVWAWNRLADPAGRATVGALAAELGWSRKHLATRFREHFGLSPKQIGRILRFQRVVELLQHEPTAAWIDIALRCGYYDQSHLVRDFRQFAGCAPGEFDCRFLGEGGGVMDGSPHGIG